jgi:pimeloyl-ACP methyl ester carboxylesterase
MHPATIVRFPALLALCLGTVFGCSTSASDAKGGASSSPADGGGGTSAGDSPVSSYVVVHGAWSGAWAWDAVAAQLRAKGKQVTVVELPAHGTDNTPVAGATLDAYVTKVETAVNAAPGPVVLIGHSLGGVIISQVAEQEPEHIAKLIFVAGFVPKDGDTALGLAMTDPASHLGKALTVNKDQGIGDVDPSKLIDVFCADCSTAEQAQLQAHYRTEPVAPLATPVHITAANWGAVAKYYVYTKQDNAISYPAQQAQTAQVTFVKTATLYSSHSPFLAHSDALVSALLTF